MSAHSGAVLYLVIVVVVVVMIMVMVVMVVVMLVMVLRGRRGCTKYRSWLKPAARKVTTRPQMRT